MNTMIFHCFHSFIRNRHTHTHTHTHSSLSLSLSTPHTQLSTRFVESTALSSPHTRPICFDAQNDTGGSISGTVALGITYGSNVVCAATIAPVFVRRFGVKACMLFQFTAFVTIVCANACVSSPFTVLLNSSPCSFMSLGMFSTMLQRSTFFSCAWLWFAGLTVLANGLSST